MILCCTSGFQANCMHQSLLSCSLELSLVFGKRLIKEWPWTDRVKVYLARMADEETWDGLSEERTAWQVQNARVTIKTTRKELDVEPQTLPSEPQTLPSEPQTLPIDTCCPSLSPYS